MTNLIGEVLFGDLVTGLTISLSYSRAERLVRWLGKTLRLKRLRFYHERIPWAVITDVDQGDNVLTISRKTDEPISVEIEEELEAIIKRLVIDSGGSGNDFELDDEFPCPICGATESHKPECILAPKSDEPISVEVKL